MGHCVMSRSQRCLTLQLHLTPLTMSLYLLVYSHILHTHYRFCPGRWYSNWGRGVPGCPQSPGDPQTFWRFSFCKTPHIQDNVFLCCGERQALWCLQTLEICFHCSVSPSCLWFAFPPFSFGMGALLARRFVELINQKIQRVMSQKCFNWALWRLLV